MSRPIAAPSTSSFIIAHRPFPVQAGEGEGRLACNQVLYHLQQRSIEHAVLPWCEMHGVAVTGYSPFGYGRFSASHTESGRLAKERAMRRRQLKRLWARFKQLSTMRLTREELLMKLGAARDHSRTAWRLVTIEVAAEDATFSYRLDRNKLRQVVDSVSRDPTDQPLSVIATPTHAIRIKRPSGAPTGIDWTRLSAEDLEEMPILAELKRMTTSNA